MGLLRDILAQKGKEVAALRTSATPQRPAGWASRDVAAALRRPPGAPLRLIAEIKFRSPSAGSLSRALGPSERARAYEVGGASMVSVLTVRTCFDGSLDDLSAARRNVALPVLCKDFIIDPAQLDGVAAAGADAALVIVRCFEDSVALDELVDATRGLGLEPF